jgi:transposase
MVRRVVVAGWSLTVAAEAAGVSERTCSKWVKRFRCEGEVGLWDRSSAPARVPHRTPEDRVQAIAALRRLRMTGAEIAELLSMPLSTVSALLKSIGLGKRSRLEPPEPPNRYERSGPGELVHVDVKKLARFHRPGHRMLGRGPGRFEQRPAGYDYVHVCVDDYSRLAYAEVLPNERATTAIAFLRRATKWFAERGVEVRAVMTDNGSAYRSKLHKLACIALAVKHLRTRPRRPSVSVSMPDTNAFTLPVIPSTDPRKNMCVARSAGGGGASTSPETRRRKRLGRRRQPRPLEEASPQLACTVDG